MSGTQALPGVQTLRVEIQGTRPLLMNNVRTANPLDEFTQQMKEISGKRKKTDDDHRRLADLEWEARLYLEDGKIVLPRASLKACLITGGKKSKMGTTIRSAVFIGESAELIFDGPRSLAKLKKDPAFRLTTMVSVQRTKVLRTRPRFPVGWSATFDLEFDEDEINRSDIETALLHAGKAGIGDYRPDYGRFQVNQIMEVSG